MFDLKMVIMGFRKGHLDICQDGCGTRQGIRCRYGVRWGSRQEVQVWSRGGAEGGLPGLGRW